MSDLRGRVLNVAAKIADLSSELLVASGATAFGRDEG